MFGSGRKRRVFNGAVNTRLNNEYQISTDSDANPLFPAPLAYLKLIDQQWKNRHNEHEAALAIACMYFCGCAEGDIVDEARRVHERILAVSQFGVEHGQISEPLWELYRDGIEKRYALVGLDEDVETSSSPTEESSVPVSVENTPSESEIDFDAETNELRPSGDDAPAEPSAAFPRKPIGADYRGEEYLEECDSRLDSALGGWEGSPIDPLYAALWKPETPMSQLKNDVFEDYEGPVAYARRVAPGLTDVGTIAVVAYSATGYMAELQELPICYEEGFEELDEKLQEAFDAIQAVCGIVSRIVVPEYDERQS